MQIPDHRDEDWMALALAEARRAAEAGEVPVGAVVVRGGALLGRGANRNRRDSVIHAHAELVALGAAQRAAADYRLDGAEIFVTLEPCLMCLGAIHQSRLGRLVYGAAEPKFGALESRFALQGHPALSRLEVRGGVCASACAALLSEFFQELRLSGAGQ